MYVIIDEEYRVYQKEVLSGRIRRLARDGKISVLQVNLDYSKGYTQVPSIKVRGMNRPDQEKYYGYLEWSPIQQLPDDFDTTDREEDKNAE